MATSPPQYSDIQKSALVQQIVSGTLSLEEACARYGVSTEQLKDGVRVFRRNARQALDHQLRSTLRQQGLDPGELSRAELSGSLKELAVADLLQTIQMGRKDVHIRISHAGAVSELWCRDGEVIDARSGSLEGEAAFYRIMALDEGRIVADFVPTARVRKIELATPRLLLKAAASNGLRARLVQRIGDPAQVLVVATAVTARRAAHLEADEIDVLSLFDGVRSVEEVAFASGLPDARALDIVARFREDGLLVTAVPQKPASERQPPSETAAPAAITMSYQPPSSSREPAAGRPSPWTLAAGAVLCSSLGAISALAVARSTAPSPTPPELAREHQTRSPSAALALPAPSAVIPPGTASITPISTAASDSSPGVSAPPGPELRASAGFAPGALGASLGGGAPSSALPGARPTAQPDELRRESSGLGHGSARARCPEDMVWIEAGQFRMGSDSEQPALGLARPAHPVAMRGFCLDVHEVTVAKYAACVDAGECTPAHRQGRFADSDLPSGAPDSAALERGAMCNAGRAGRDRHPINCVSQSQAAAYCAAQSARLPTEAEWEFAARGPRSLRFPWGDQKPTRARVNACGKECARRHARERLGSSQGVMYGADDGYAGTAPVGSFPSGASSDGIMDLIGNVFEWTSDGLYDYEESPRENPRGPSDAESVVIRGGNFNSGLREFADPALRFAMARESYSHGVGFRCAADPGRSDARLPASGRAQ